MFTSRDMGYLEKLIIGIFATLLKGIQDTSLFTSRDIGYWYPPYTSLIIDFAYLDLIFQGHTNTFNISIFYIRSS